MPIAETFIEALFKGLGAQITKKGFEPVAASAKKGITQVWNHFKFEKAAQAYQNEMLRLYSTMKILGMNAPTDLGSIFTHVNILEKQSASCRSPSEQIQEIFLGKGSFGEYRETKPGMDVVRRYDKLFILGKPGAGKTTFLKYLVLQAIKGKLDKIPIFIPLKAYSDSGLPLKDFVVKLFEICSFPDATEYVSLILKEGKGLLLFDGLDEVKKESELRATVTQEIIDICNTYNKCPAIITCRIAATDATFEHFTTVEMADFNPEQVHLFIEKWFTHDPETLKMFLDEFDKEEQKGLRELAQSPLLLTLICLSFEETLNFPARRSEIYKDALDALLKKWDSSRRIKRDDVYQKLSHGRKQQMLSNIAAISFEKGKFLMDEEWLGKQIVAFLQTLPESELPEDIDGVSILKAIEAQHGVFVERSNGVYSYSHLTFQEYFVARYIVDNEARGAVRGLVENHFLDDSWREVILLTSEMLDTSDDFLDCIFEQPFMKPQFNSVSQNFSDTEEITHILVNESRDKENNKTSNPQISTTLLVIPIEPTTHTIDSSNFFEVFLEVLTEQTSNKQKISHIDIYKDITFEILTKNSKDKKPWADICELAEKCVNKSRTEKRTHYLENLIIPNDCIFSLGEYEKLIKRLTTSSDERT